MPSLKEIQEEFSGVISGGGGRILDSVLPLLVFLVVVPLAGADLALWLAVFAAAVLLAVRRFQHKSLVYALGGLGGMLIAAVFVRLSGSEAGIFVPGLISGSVLVLLCVISVLLGRPLVAWTSFIARRWPINWYWHPRVLPAYNEITILWAVAFAIRLVLEYWFFQSDAAGLLAGFRLLLGWPFTVLLLIGSYVYGVWRLGTLKGPSVEEFKSGSKPPWEGQKRGF
jgi:hypothetical protein